MNKFLAAVAFSAISLNAAAITFTGSYSATVNTNDPGLDVAVAPPNGPLNFSLNAGQQTSWISLFRIFTYEDWVNEDDVVPMTASVAFNFTSPSASNGTSYGSTYGESFVFGLWQHGVIRWNNGGLNSLLFSEGILDVFLKDTQFGGGFLGLNSDSGVVQAKFGLRANPTTAVPEPTMLVVFGAGLIAIGLLRRRRSTAVAE
jgi:hypothetical protein